MTIGLIFECGPQGADKQVCEYLVGAIRPGLELTCKTLGNKENLLRDAGRVAAQMLKDGCRCVLIIWDLRPSWPDKKEKPCRAAERQQLRKPKALMNNHFKDARGWVYEDHADAIRVMKAADLDFRRLRRSPTFVRFETKLQECV